MEFAIRKYSKIQSLTALVITLFPGGPGSKVTSKPRDLSIRLRLPFAD